MDKRDAERARFVVSLAGRCVCRRPTALAGNPAALKKLVDTGGASLLHGLENFVGDLARNGGMPAQVDTRKFAVGKNLATTPGSVVYRSPVMELIQYRPGAPRRARASAADRAAADQQILCVRSRTRQEHHSARAERRPADIRDQLEEPDGRRKPLWARHLCGGPRGRGRCDARDHRAARTSTSGARARVASPRRRFWQTSRRATSPKVHSATIAVCVLDMAVAQDTTAGMFVTPESIVAAKHASQLAGVLEGQELARMFAWMRPNDLIWNYWVNNYLLGNAPPAFDVLYWNNDTTRLAGAAARAISSTCIGTNPFVNPGQLAVRGTSARHAPGERGQLCRRRPDRSHHAVAGLLQHGEALRSATARSCSPTTATSRACSIRPDNPKAFFWAGAAREAATPDAWLGQAEKHSGSWWPHWLEWIKARSGEMTAAPVALGSAQNPPLGPRPVNM